MKRTGFLKSLVTRYRPYEGTELRHAHREEAEGRFAGLGLRGQYFIVMLHNWSSGGVCVQMPLEAKVGERVKVTSGALNRIGRICWVDGARAGVEFD